jgi:hypothetical protein
MPAFDASAPGPESGAAAASGFSWWDDGTMGAASAVGGPAAEPAAMTAPSGKGAGKLGPVNMWFAGLAGLLVILAGVSVYGLVELSSVEASLSHAQQQVSSVRAALSAEQHRVSSDEQQISTLQSSVDTVSGLSSLAGYTSVCSMTNVPFSGQLETAYLPCTDQNPG